MAAVAVVSNVSPDGYLPETVTVTGSAKETGIAPPVKLPMASDPLGQVTE